jgi:small subunit ribosomal protein S13
MPRISGIDIPNDKPTVISLTYIFGIGNKTAARICDELGLDRQKRAKELTEDELARIAGMLTDDLMVEGHLRRQVQQNIARLRDIACYRGLRHRRGLPVPQGPA